MMTIDAQARADLRAAMWRDKILEERGAGKVDPKCPTCFGTGELHGKSCAKCFPEDHPPYRYLFPRTPDPEKAGIKEHQLAEATRASDEAAYQHSTGVDQ